MTIEGLSNHLHKHQVQHQGTSALRISNPTQVIMSLAETVLTLAKTNQAKIVGLAAIAVFLGYSLTFRKSSGKVIKSSLTNAAATLV